jgi:hypothetical protein
MPLRLGPARPAPAGEIVHSPESMVKLRQGLRVGRSSALVVQQHAKMKIPRRNPPKIAVDFLIVEQPGAFHKNAGLRRALRRQRGRENQAS